MFGQKALHMSRVKSNNSFPSKDEYHVRIDTKTFLDSYDIEKNINRFVRNVHRKKFKGKWFFPNIHDLD